jgi:hypothetical protein
MANLVAGVSMVFVMEGKSWEEASRVPQSPQKRCVSGFSELHFGHCVATSPPVFPRIGYKAAGQESNGMINEIEKAVNYRCLVR